MSHRFRLAALLTALLSSSVAAAQPAPKVTLHGKVVDDLRGAPVDKVSLTLTTGKSREKITAETDSLGAFTIPGVTPGAYRISLLKTGYLTDQSVDVDIPTSAGFELDELTFLAARNITGTVRWDDGDPVEYAALHVFPIIDGKVEDAVEISRRTWTTDSRGVYRIPNLRPGRYAVLVGYIGPRPGPAPPDGFPPRATSPVYYPGTPSILNAGAVDVSQTLEAGNINVTLTELSSVSVQGTVSGAALPPRESASLGLIIPGMPARATDSIAVRPGEPFRFRAPEGDYYVIARSPGSDVLGMYPLRIGREPIRDLRIALPEPGSFTGKVEVESDSQSNAVSLGGIQILGHSARLGWYDLHAVSRPTGECSFREFVPGESYALTFLGLPEGAYVARVVQRDQVQKAYPFTVTPSDGPVQITLKIDSGTISGSVSSEAGPAARAFVVLAPKDRSQRPRFRTSRLDANGAFHLTHVVPGDYDLFAFDRDEGGRYLDGTYLRTYARRATEVTVAPNASSNFQLSLTPVGAK